MGGGIAKISGHTRWGVSLLVLFLTGLLLLNNVKEPGYPLKAGQAFKIKRLGSLNFRG